MDDNYQTYLNRVAKSALPETYKSQLQHIQASPKFQPLPDGRRKAVAFPGYTVMTPPAEEDAQNTALYQSLEKCQQQLLQFTDNLIVPVPPSSFHLTLADLIWENAYQYAQENTEKFELQLHSAIAKIFEQFPQITDNNPIRWQILGLLIMPRAIGVALVPQNEIAYNRILQLRRAIYQSPELTALGMEQHYHFTAHITLGYFGEVTPELDRDRLSTTIAELNYQCLENTPELSIYRAELRKFDDMTRYYREQNWTVLEF
ncbi:DUF1868 domain-containing protein [Aliterella atlantica]|uniref:DUF1868 domain-containing protein n=1 Tax=Aliterella atlantica CENA595 TaxID=1618023 RepID=A0A0D8ZXP5_9CYAN|nr:DUF1868 domain-containing protein [Aliterella atlantica]KJH73548.1 hypothetical protein UH38_01940 [Aliterella atlantica CENA595]